MALTYRTNGSGVANLVNAGWFDDYYNLLTGVMTDQPVTITFSPTSAGGSTLSLKGNANSSRLSVYDSGGTLQVLVTAAGLLQDGGGHNYGILVGTGTATAGRQIFVGTTTPTGANEGDIWIKA